MSTRQSYGTVVIVCPPVDDVAGIHEARLYNLTEYVDANGWTPIVVREASPFIDVHIDRLVLIAREGYTVEALAKTIRRNPTNSGFAKHPLDWTDIDKCRLDTGMVFTGLAEQGDDWPVHDWRELVVPPDEPVKLKSRFRKFGDKALRAVGGSLPGHRENETDDLPAAEPVPLVAFAGDALPRRFPEPRLVAPDGSFIASLHSGDLQLSGPTGTATHHFRGWLDQLGLEPNAHLLAVGHESGVYRAIVSAPHGTFSVLSSDRKGWLPPEQVGATVIAAALVAEDVLLVDALGQITINGSPLAAVAASELSVSGVDVVSRKGVGTWLVIWGVTPTGERSAVVLRRDRASWMHVARFDDVVRAGLERTSAGQVGRGNRGVWLERADGSTDRSEVGGA